MRDHFGPGVSRSNEGPVVTPDIPVKSIKLGADLKEPLGLEEINHSRYNKVEIALHLVHDGCVSVRLC